MLLLINYNVALEVGLLRYCSLAMILKEVAWKEETKNLLMAWYVPGILLITLSDLILAENLRSGIICPISQMRQPRPNNVEWIVQGAHPTVVP